MKTSLECFSCLVNRAFRAAIHATDDEVLIRKILDETGCLLKDISMEGSPPETGEILCRRIHEITNVCTGSL